MHNHVWAKKCAKLLVCIWALCAKHTVEILLLLKYVILNLVVDEKYRLNKRCVGRGAVQVNRGGSTKCCECCSTWKFDSDIEWMREMSVQLELHFSEGKRLRIMKSRRGEMRALHKTMTKVTEYFGILIQIHSKYVWYEKSQFIDRVQVRWLQVAEAISHCR